MHATEFETRHEFETLRDLVLYYGGRRGWHTQRQIAVMCGLDESALSRFLNGEQDLGARRTHALFCAVGVPVDRYDLAYALLGRAQELAKQSKEARSASVVVAEPTQRLLHFRSRRPPRGPVMQKADRAGGVSAFRRAGIVQPSFGGPRLIPLDDETEAGDLPAAALIALFAAGGYSGPRIAEFFGT
jgi:hypothetical protein